MNPVFRLGRLAAVLITAWSVPAQGIVRTDAGIGADERMGAAIAALADLDGDSVSDYAVGIPDADYPGMPDRGQVRIRSGRTGLYLHSLVGPRAGMRLGSALAAVGDVDGDLVPDLAAGAPDDAAQAGSVLVFSGATGALLRTLQGRPLSRLGASLATIGDFDGDGRNDLVVGAPGVPGAADADLGVRVYRLADGAVIAHWTHPQGQSAQFGSSLANVGDTDGNGLDDVAAGAPGANAPLPSAGQVFLLRTYGNHGWTIPQPWSGSAPSEYFGYRVAAAGDVDGDGVPDVATCSPVLGNGSAWILRAASLQPWRTIQGPNAGEGFGASLAGIGDIDGDDRPEIAVGATLAGGLAGRTYVFDGGTGGELFHLDGAAGDRAGTAIAGLGDVDGDNQPDFAVTRPYADGPTTDCGAVDLIWVALPGSYRVFGHGCPGSNGVPTIGGVGIPQLGGIVQFRGRMLPAARPCFALLGLSDTAAAGGVALPLDLGAFGFAGCALLVSPDAPALTAANSIGTAVAVVQVPLVLALTGIRLFGQFAGLDANGGLAFTPGAEARIGR
jgi:hypothetical protein